MTTPSRVDKLEAVKEKLAAIEHERWSDWQNWVHRVYLEGNFGEFMLRWQKQIATPYDKLTRKEQLSDLEQVDRYWPLILALLDQARIELALSIHQILDENDMPQEIHVPKFSKEVRHGILPIEPFRYAQQLSALSEIRKLVTGELKEKRNNE